MSKTHFILLVAFIGFYVSLTAYLLLSACAASLGNLRRRLAPKLDQFASGWKEMRRRAAERAEWHGQVVLDLQRASLGANVAGQSQRKALC